MSRPASLSSRPDFSGLWIPLVTPFRDGAVDHPALAALARRLAGQGVAGFVVCGSTGEAAALDEDERLAVLHTVASAAPDVPRMMGLGGEHLGHLLHAVRRLAGRGLAALLVPAPSYVRPSQAGLQQWFTAIADASDVPVLVYDIPYRTGSTLARETLQALAAHPNIVGVKDCSGDAAKVRALIADGRLQVLAGEDAQVLATMAEGGTGAIAASAHVHTVRWVRLVAALETGRLAQARALWQPLAPLVEALFAEPNPGPVKALLASGGEMTGELRAPMTGASPALLERLRAIDAAIAPVEG
ncbi:MAG: 4-hydroxy-tetrahydrodipicolinate synthase [Bordetella sp.]|nr:4-hydroxy-tetrahydrodipicolinate synthase [Pseudomonadota bacterium]